MHAQSDRLADISMYPLEHQTGAEAVLLLALAPAPI